MTPQELAKHAASSCPSLKTRYREKHKTPSAAEVGKQVSESFNKKQAAMLPQGTMGQMAAGQAPGQLAPAVGNMVANAGSGNMLPQGSVLDMAAGRAKGQLANPMSMGRAVTASYKQANVGEKIRSLLKKKKEVPEQVSSMGFKGQVGPDPGGALPPFPAKQQDFQQRTANLGVTPPAVPTAPGGGGITPTPMPPVTTPGANAGPLGPGTTGKMAAESFKQAFVGGGIPGMGAMRRAGETLMAPGMQGTAARMGAAGTAGAGIGAATAEEGERMQGAMRGGALGAGAMGAGEALGSVDTAQLMQRMGRNAPAPSAAPSPVASASSMAPTSPNLNRTMQLNPQDIVASRPVGTPPRPPAAAGMVDA